MRGTVTKPKLGFISQGTIFTCAAAEDYATCNVRGIVITARCDIAQSKAPIYSYLPVVSLDDWIHRDGRSILCDRLMKNLVGRMKACLREVGYSDSILVTQRSEDILDTLFQDTKAHQRAKDRFSELSRSRDLVLECLESDVAACRTVELGDQYNSERDALLRELAEQRLNGYYFLQSITPDDEQSGYVILLRHVHHIPRSLAEFVSKGFLKEEYESYSQYAGRLSFDVEEFAMPIGALTSPLIEHVMQVFSALFGRIGLPDLDPDYIEAVWERQPSVGRRRNEVRGL